MDLFSPTNEDEIPIGSVGNTPIFLSIKNPEHEAPWFSDKERKQLDSSSRVLEGQISDRDGQICFLLDNSSIKLVETWNKISILVLLIY